MTLLDNILPEYQINAVYAVDIQASIKNVYRAVLDSPFVMDSLVFRILTGLRELPPKLSGKGEEIIQKEPMSLTEFFEKTNFVFLGKKENEEIVFGLIGQFWNIININLQPISDLDEFNEFDEPEYGKAVMNFYLEPLEDRVKLYTETRVYFSDDKYLSRFKVYWFFIRSFSGLTRRMFLKRIKANAEKLEVNEV